MRSYAYRYFIDPEEKLSNQLVVYSFTSRGKSNTLPSRLYYEGYAYYPDILGGTIYTTKPYSLEHIKILIMIGVFV